MTEINRRNFLKGALAAGAMTAAVGMMGCSPKAAVKRRLRRLPPSRTSCKLPTLRRRSGRSKSRPILSLRIRLPGDD